MDILFTYQMSHCFEIPVSHISPVYPGLQPSSHFPVVTLHALSFKQFPVQRYRHLGPYFPGEQSRKYKPTLYIIILHLIIHPPIKLAFSYTFD